MKKHIAFLIFSLLLTACQINPVVLDQTSDEVYWPTDGWLSGAPQEHGMDGRQIDIMFEEIDQKEINLHSLLIIKDGYIVAERYYDEFSEDTPHIQYSVTKSFTSALVGIALEEGYILSLDQTVVDFFPEYAITDTAKASITLENILTMRTGLGWIEGNTGYYELSTAQDPLAYMLELPMIDEPGSEFRYCSGCSFLLSAIILKTTGINTAEYAEEKLFSPLGIEDVTWESLNDGTTNGGWGLYLTPRQMAKFGYLFLNEGEWDGKQIIPAEWVADSSETGRVVDNYVDYGYQWWIYKDLNIYAAQGLYGQKIYILPEENMVVIMTAELNDENEEYSLLVNYILPAISD